MKAIRRFHVRTVLPEPLAPLGELASNLRWSWHPRTRDLFRDIDPDRWQRLRHDPAALLASLSADELAELAGDDVFVGRVRQARESLQRYLTSPGWYQKLDGGSRPAAIAYFSAEFGITHVLPQYSGGLGILAGDHLKSASDLGVPVVGIGLFYQSGYFKQGLDAEGWQQERYPVLDADDLPLSLLRDEDGSPAKVSMQLPGRMLCAQVWQAQVGRVPLLLLDANVEDNDGVGRELTSRLYGGGGEQRLQQEMLLGIGGVRALRLFSRLTGALAPEVYHCNEGHAGFLSLERVSELVTRERLDLESAVEVVRASNVFTTHTPVPAGIDRFGLEQMRSHFGGECELPGVPVDRVLPLGAEDYPGGDPHVFNMAVMGLRLAQRSNGVSRLHGAVSRSMFRGLWPGFDVDEVPITSITNGVHAPTWMDRRMTDLAKEYLGLDSVRGATGWDQVSTIPIEQLWRVKRELRMQLVQDVRRRVRKSQLRRGATPAELSWVDEVLDPDVLTIGFARRVPTYKRLTLMLRDPERLRRLLLHPERPVQIVVAGKSHPADEQGKKLIQQMVRFTDDPQLRRHIVFLPNYDIAMAQQLYPGCDVWLNNPLRPFEACGTSGMKAALNGALNLSILDGWWDEWYDSENGWAIPTADGVDDERRDDLESAALYELIESSVRTRFYDRDESGLPQHWLRMMAHTLQTLGPRVLATRMVEDYTRLLYLPAAEAGRRMRSGDFAQARDLSAYRARVRKAFDEVRVEHVDSDGVSDTPQVGDHIQVRAHVSLGGLDPEDVEVQVVHGRVGEDDGLTDVRTEPLKPVEAQPDGQYRFDGEVTITRTGAFGYTVRVLPRHTGLVSAAELGLVANA